jgi:hypothetical protein
MRKSNQLPNYYAINGIDGQTYIFSSVTVSTFDQLKRWIWKNTIDQGPVKWITRRFREANQGQTIKTAPALIT